MQEVFGRIAQLSDSYALNQIAINFGLKQPQLLLVANQKMKPVDFQASHLRHYVLVVEYAAAYREGQSALDNDSVANRILQVFYPDTACIAIDTNGNVDVSVTVAKLRNPQFVSPDPVRYALPGQILSKEK